MYLAQKHISRRTALKGLGVTISLPFLEAMSTRLPVALNASFARCCHKALSFGSL